MSFKYTYAELPVKLPAISLAVNINPVSPIGIAGGGLCIADGRKATAYIRGPDGTLTPVYGDVTVVTSVPNPISGPVNISGFRRVVGGRSDHPHPAAFAHLASSGQVSLGELVRRGVFDR